jgi:uncharacterized protein (TIGR03790 family)
MPGSLGVALALKASSDNFINIRGHETFPRAAGAARAASGLWAAALLFCGAGAAGAGTADRVVLVANSDAPESVAIARHYADVRGVPAANIIALRMPVEETISWKEFVATIWQPLEAELVKKGWIDAIPMDVFDDVGRREYAVSGHRIAALVLCRGVPLRIANDPALYKEVEPLTGHPELRTNQGAVDSELSLLAQSDYPINAYVVNPLFHNVQPTDYAREQVVKVSRLDGPAAADALHLVDLAVQAERSGLLGRAYVDIAGPHESGDLWLADAASNIRSLGFDLTVDRSPTTFPATARIDAPALYLGWYTPDLNGPFSLPGFRFPPGAIAVHIHSFSAHTLRSASEGWCGPLLARGAAATVGNVYEPYLEYLHRPDLLMEALARGDDLVDAAYYALPVLSWQSIVVGDPLYRPFKVPLAAQLQDLSALPAPLAGYAVIRQMNLLDAAGRQEDAVAAGKAAMKQAPNMALALALARRLQASGNTEAATWVISSISDTADLSPSNWELVCEAASFLSASKKSAEAIDLYRRLFDVDAIPPAIRATWLAEARRVALEGGDTGQAAQWEEEMGQIVAKPAGAAP